VQEKKIKVNGVKRGTGELENVIKEYLFDEEATTERKPRRPAPAVPKQQPWCKGP